MTTQALTVVDRRTGEILDVASAETEQLAEFVSNLKDLRGELADAEALVSAELVARLDRGGCWTQRVGDVGEGGQWEITAPSPTAGTETYPERDLERELRALVERGTINADGADRALDRSLAVQVRVPLDVDLEALAGRLKDALGVEIAGTPVEITAATPLRKARKAGIAALRKVPGTTAALDRVRETLPTGSRRAAVKLIERGA